MEKKLSKLTVWIFLLCSIFLTSCKGTSKSNIITGEWNDNIFTNTWSNITFELPFTYEAIHLNELGSIPGQTNDFFLLNEDQTANITVMYVDLLYQNQQNLSTEEYLNTVKQQLANSKNKDYNFASNFENVFIAEEEYLMLHSEFYFKEFSTEGTNYQDGYARKFDNAIIVFLVCYSDETKDYVDSFLSSIKRIK